MANGSSLRDTVEQVRERIQRHRELDEQNTKASLIDPVFRSLGWDMEDLDEVRREYKQRPSDGPVDYALFVAGEPRLFIEAKKLGSNLADRRWASQVVGYATTAGVEWVVLTDGNEYRIYNSHAAVPVEQKLLRSVRLTDGDDQDLAGLELLSKAQIHERNIDAVWRAHYVDQQVLSVLEGLFTPEPDPSLVRLLGKRLEGLTKGQITGGLKRIRASFEATPGDAPPPPPDPIGALPIGEYQNAVRTFLAAEPSRRATVEQVRKAIQRALPLGTADHAVDERGRAVWRRRVALALTRMKRRGELLNPNHGVWELAPGGTPTKPRSRRGRPEGQPSVGDLIAAGLIHPPTQVEATYLKQRVTATINSAGEFELEGEVFKSPSRSAGRARGLVKGDGRIYSTNGWGFWHVRQPDGSLVTLSALLKRLGKGL
jgi:hypothetical protein